MTEATIGARRLDQLSDLDRLGRRERGEQQLGDPVARLDLERLGAVGVQYQHPNFTAVAGVD
jgi:hypothetical protein